MARFSTAVIFVIILPLSGGCGHFLQEGYGSRLSRLIEISELMGEDESVVDPAAGSAETVEREDEALPAQ